MSKNRARVYAHVKQDRFVLETAEDATPWVGSADVSLLTTSVNHREGSASLSFSKSEATETFGQIARTLDAEKQLNLVEFLDGYLKLWINLSDLTDIASVQLIIGESASHNYVYQVADSDLSAGWNLLSFAINEPASTTGNGAAWSSIGYIAVKVNFDAAGNTLAAILVDSISAVYELSVNINNINLDGTGIASETTLSEISSALGHSETTLLSLTNIAAGTTAYAYFDMDGYRFFSLQGETSDALPVDVLTVTVEATNQDDGTAQTACAYQDITLDMFGVASYVDTDFFAAADTPVAFKFVRVKYVTSAGGGNDADLTVYLKRMN